MVTHEQIKRGLARYMDSEFIPKLPVGSVKKVVIGTASALMLQNLDKSIKALSEHPLVGVLGIVDEHGNIDVDRLAEEVKIQMGSDGMKFDLKILGLSLGAPHFDCSDVDKLRAYINS